MVTCGKLKAEQAGEISEILAHDLRNYPMDWVEDAIRQHKEESPFWPSLSDLMKFIRPRVEWQRRASERKRREEEIARYKANEAPEDPQEIRTAAAEKWRQEGRARLEELSQEQEKEEQEWKPPSRGKMLASVRRIAEFERASGDPKRIAVANKMMEGITP